MNCDWKRDYDRAAAMKARGRNQMRPVAFESSSSSEPVVIRPCAPASFLTKLGALAKARQLRQKGFPPDLKDWRIITLTIDPARFPCPEDAYEVAHRHLRQFIYSLRQAGFNFCRYCWKLEFGSPDEQGWGYPHFHVLLDYKRRIPSEVIAAAWGKGRTEVQRVTKSRRLFGYLTKGVEHLPQWALARHRIRFWQTSSGFYSEKAQSQESRLQPAFRGGGRTRSKMRRLPESIGEKLSRWRRYCTLIYGRTSRGNPVFRCVELACTWNQAVVKLARASLDHADLFRGRQGFSVSGFKIQLPTLTCFNLFFPVKKPFLLASM